MEHQELNCYNMPTLKSKTTEYSFSPAEIKKLIAKDLEADESKISVRYVIREVGGDPMDRFPGTPTVTSIDVTINNT